MLRLISLTSVLALSTLSCSGSKPAASGTESVTGENSGDEIRLLFSDVKPEAARMVRDFSANQLPGIDPAAIDFLKAQKNNLANEIGAMPHDWSERPEQMGCASTNSGLGDPIYFSFSQCRNEISSKEMAEKLLVHEAVHHFGYGTTPSNEAFADQVAMAVYQAAQDRRTGFEGTTWLEGIDLIPTYWTFKGGALTRNTFGGDEQGNASQQIDRGSFTYDGLNVKWTPDYTSCPRLGVLPSRSYQVSFSDDHLEVQLIYGETTITLKRISGTTVSYLPISCADGVSLQNVILQ